MTPATPSLRRRLRPCPLVPKDTVHALLPPTTLATPSRGRRLWPCPPAADHTGHALPRPMTPATPSCHQPLRPCPPSTDHSGQTLVASTSAEPSDKRKATVTDASSQPPLKKQAIDGASGIASSNFQQGNGDSFSNSSTKIQISSSPAPGKMFVANDGAPSGGGRGDHRRDVARRGQLQHFHKLGRMN